MACKKVMKSKRQLLATLVTGDKAPCAFCQREVDDELTYGKLYAIGDIQCHYFCVLLSCCLVQKGRDTEGLFGFLYPDIIAEVERSKKHRCSYCGKGGAGLGCCVAQCRKQFHLPCGRERNAVTLFYGNFKTYCQLHAPKQKIPNHIMEVAKLRMKRARSGLKAPRNLGALKELCPEGQGHEASQPEDTESVCVICYEAVEGYPTVVTFWPPCCARDAWFHRTCLQRMALSAGMHYLKCPLCNDKDNFYQAVISQGYYVPDRDAAWELEQNAFAEIYERPLSCSAEECKCPMGRNHDAETGSWDIKLCILCGTSGGHASCVDSARFVCTVCKPAAPTNLDALAAEIEAEIQAEQNRASRAALRPVMPSRMSLRRTKARVATNMPSTSQYITTMKTEDEDKASNTITSRLDLNLKTPTKQTNEDTTAILRNIENTMFSPTKLIEEGINNKLKTGAKVVHTEVICMVKKRLRKPRPLSVKKRIVNNALKELFDNLLRETHKSEERSPLKKVCDVGDNLPEENQQNVVDTNEEIHKTTDNNCVESLGTPIKEEKSTGGDNIPLMDEETQDVLENKDTNKDKCTENFKESVENHTDDIVTAIKNEDDSSNSTFQLPSEFVADRNSEDSFPLFDTPKLKTVDIKKDSSLEISENDDAVNIDVVKMEENSDNKEFIMKLDLKTPVKKEKCALKFNPLDKEALQEEKLDIDIESFKSYYLNEVDRAFQCNYSHKHKHDKKKETPVKLRTAIDFALDATFKKGRTKILKRKLESKDGVAKKKKRKDKKVVLKYEDDDSKHIKVVCSENENKGNTESIDLTVGSPKLKKTKKNKKNKKTRENIHVKIKFRKEQVRLKITKELQTKKKLKKKKKERKESKLKQYILQYYENSSPNKVIVKPEQDVTPKKKKHVKLEKSPDNLIQTSIQSFFKKVPTPTE